MMAAHKTSFKNKNKNATQSERGSEGWRGGMVMSQKNANTGGYGSKHIIGSRLILRFTSLNLNQRKYA